MEFQITGFYAAEGEEQLHKNEIRHNPRNDIDVGMKKNPQKYGQGHHKGFQAGLNCMNVHLMRDISIIRFIWRKVNKYRALIKKTGRLLTRAPCFVLMT